MTRARKGPLVGRIRPTWLRRTAATVEAILLAIIVFGGALFLVLAAAIWAALDAAWNEVCHCWDWCALAAGKIRRQRLMYWSAKYHADRDAAIEEAWAKVPGRRRR